MLVIQQQAEANKLTFIGWMDGWVDGLVDRPATLWFRHALLVVCLLSVELRN
jgi:hypothetical protein